MEPSSSIPTISKPRDAYFRPRSFDIVGIDELEAARAEIRIARRGQQRRNFETRWVHKDGRIVPLAWSAVWSESEQCHFLIGRDMTESKKGEEALIDSERMALDAII